MNKKKKAQRRAIVIFPDGETWNTAQGCTILTITEADLRRIAENDYKLRGLKYTRRIEVGETSGGNVTFNGLRLPKVVA